MNNNKLTKLEAKEIQELLAQFGLNEKDRLVYLAILKMGKNTLSPIANAIELPITTTQSVLKRLANLGLIEVSKQKTKSIYEANSPIVLKKILKRQIEDIENSLPLFNKIKAEVSDQSKIKIYYRERVTDIFHEALNSKEKLVHEIVSAKDFQEIIGEKFHFTKRRIKNNVHLRSLRVETQEIKKYNKSIHEREMRQAKFLPKELNFRASIMFWDNKIAFFTTKNEGLAWVVESKIMRETIEQIFNMLWSFSRRMETLEEK